MSGSVKMEAKWASAMAIVAKVKHVLDLRRYLGNLGAIVGRKPAHFLVTPVLVMLFFMTGLQRIRFETDPEVLFVPYGSPALDERVALEKLFPTDYNEFVIGHESVFAAQINIMVLAKDGKGMLRKRIWSEVAHLNNLMSRNVTLQHGKDLYTFGSLCAKRLGKCVENDFLDLLPYADKIEKGDIQLTYPAMKNPISHVNFFLPSFFGGVTTLNGSSIIAGVSAFRLVYNLDASPDRVLISQMWEEAALAVTAKLKFNHIDIKVISSKTIEKELDENINSAIEYVSYCVLAITIYTILNAMHKSIADAKPMVGFLGIVSTLMATGGSWGLIMYTGYPWQSINLASLFLILGVGLDDTFVMLSSWSRTPKTASVPERMRLCYDEAIMSITITNLTNLVSFAVGIAVPGFKCVEIFSVYTGVGLLFVYICTLTFYGACLAISGYAEIWLLGAMTKWPALLRRTHTKKTVGEEEGGYGRYLYRDVIGQALTKPVFKGLVLLLFAAYLAVSVYSISNLKEGLERRKLARDDSVVVEFYNAEDTYFRANPYRFQIAIVDPIDYSSGDVQAQVLSLLDSFRASPFVSHYQDLEEIWLKEFLTYAKDKNMLEETDISTPESFVQELIPFLAAARTTQIGSNVVLNENGTGIVASRFFLQSSVIRDAVEEAEMVRTLRQIAASAPFRVIVFHPYFPYFDQYLQVRPNTISSIWVCCVVILGITIVALPDLVSDIWITVVVLSIELGVVGFMVIWGIHLDVISLISLIMCAGFSIDYAAHIAFHFVTSRDLTPNERILESLDGFGLPVTQAATSTLLATSCFFLLPSYILQSFSKLMLIVVLSGVVHGLFVLPVLLSLLTPDACKNRNKKKVSPVKDIPMKTFASTQTSFK